MSKTRKWAPLALALLAVSMVGSPAFAKDHGNGHGRGHYKGGHGQYQNDYDRDRARHYDRGYYSQRNNYRDRRDAYRDGYRDGRRHDWDRGYRRPPVVVYRQEPRRVYRTGYAGPPPWARGRDYRSYGYNNVYYVPYNEYNRYSLYDPGRDRRWVRDDRGNFLLVAAATGIITSVLMNHAF